MKKIFTVALLILISIPIMAKAEDAPVKSKFPLKIYGMLWGDSVWSDSQTDLLNNITLKSVNAPTHAVDETTITKNDKYFGITAQNTRFGVSLDDYEFENGLKAGGKLEIDFWNQNTNQFRPRMRLGYAEFGMSGWKFTGGQHWDVFSPIIPQTTNMAIMWMSGNLGYRRPQFRFAYDYSINDKQGVVGKFSVNNPGNWDLITQPGLSTGIPDIQASVGYRRKMSAGDLYAGFSGLMGFREYTSRRAVYGISLDFNLPFHKYLIISGEAAFSKGASDYFSNSSAPAAGLNPSKALSIWGNINSKWTDWFETVVGYGIDDTDMEQQAASTATAPSVNKNQMILGILKFHPVKPLTLALEYENIRTKYVGGDKGVANVLLTSVIYQF